jgi:hypothetical protein
LQMFRPAGDRAHTARRMRRRSGRPPTCPTRHGRGPAPSDVGGRELFLPGPIASWPTGSHGQAERTSLYLAGRLGVLTSRLPESGRTVFSQSLTGQRQPPKIGRATNSSSLSPRQTDGSGSAANGLQNDDQQHPASIHHRTVVRGRATTSQPFKDLASRATGALRRQRS